MAVLTADRYLVDKPGLVLSVPVADNVKIYKGALVVYDTAGYARPAADTASYVFAGIAEEQADNTVSGHAAGGISVRVRTGVRVTLPTTGATQASVGQPYYVADSGAIATTATNYVFVGQCVFYNSATSVDVEIPRGGGALLTSISGLTATAGQLNQLAGVTPGTTAASKALVVGSGKQLDVLNLTRLGFGAATAEAYAATIALDATKTLHRIAGANGTSATATINCAATGSDGDVLIIEVTSTAAGTCTITFGTNMKSSGTLAVTASHYANVMFISDGTNWKEHYRSAIITS